MDNDDQLLKILRVLGTDCFDAWLRTYGIPFETDLDALLQVSVHMPLSFKVCRVDMSFRYPKQSWSRYVTSDNHNLVTAEALDLLDKFLRYDHQKRLTAREAQAHSYFSRQQPYPLAPTSVLNHISFPQIWSDSRQPPTRRIRQSISVIPVFAPCNRIDLAPLFLYILPRVGYGVYQLFVSYFFRQVRRKHDGGDVASCIPYF